MLGAQIDVIQPQIRFFFCISTATARQKNKRQLWLNAIKRVDWTERLSNLIAFAAYTSYQKRFNNVSFDVMGASEDFFMNYINVYVHVCKTTN